MNSNHGKMVGVATWLRDYAKTASDKELAMEYLLEALEEYNAIEKESEMSPLELLKVNVNDHTEKKNGLTYLSWAWAWQEAIKADPKAEWQVKMFGRTMTNRTARLATRRWCLWMCPCLRRRSAAPAPGA